jgi:hypothetical protein
MAMNKGKDLRKPELHDLNLLRVKNTLHSFPATPEKEEQGGTKE